MATSPREKEKQLQREVTRLVEGALPGIDVLAVELTGKERFCVFVDHPQGVDHALCERVTNVLRSYLDDYSVEVREVACGGAAGGLAGGLTVHGAKLVSGFDVIADELRLDDVIAEADLVVTGEGFLDAQSFEGKVVGGVVALAAEAGVPVLAVAGEVFDEADAKMPTVSLVERFGRDRALTDPAWCIEEAVSEWLKSWSG